MVKTVRNIYRRSGSSGCVCVVAGGGGGGGGGGGYILDCPNVDLFHIAL